MDKTADVAQLPGPFEREVFLLLGLPQPALHPEHAGELAMSAGLSVVVAVEARMMAVVPAMVGGEPGVQMVGAALEVAGVVMTGPAAMMRLQDLLRVGGFP